MEEGDVALSQSGSPAASGVVMEGEFIQPGAGYALLLEGSQDFQRARCGLGVRGGRVGARPGTEVHQAATQAKQDGSQSGSAGDGYLGVRHVDIPEIAPTLSSRDDKSMTGLLIVGILSILGLTIPSCCLIGDFRHILTALFRA